MKQPQKQFGLYFIRQNYSIGIRETYFQIVLNHASPPFKNVLKSHGTAPPPQTELSKFSYPQKSRNGKFEIPP